jgi:hypothetical protein
MKPFENPEVAAVFSAYPKDMRKKLMFLRQLIFETASETPGVGELEEALKWGEPAYLTTESKSGSTVRIDWKKSNPSQYAMYFHCQTNLVQTFRAMFPSEFTYEGNRSIVFNKDDDVPIKELKVCIAMVLTYHRGKKGFSAWYPRPSPNGPAR